MHMNIILDLNQNPSYYVRLQNSLQLNQPAAQQIETHVLLNSAMSITYTFILFFSLCIFIHNKSLLFVLLALSIYFIIE